MKKHFLGSIISLLLLCSCAHHESQFTNITSEGLQAIKHRSISELYIRPQTNFEQYQQLHFDTITVSYDQKRRSNLFNLRDDDFQFDDKELAIFQEKIIKGFTKGFIKTQTESNPAKTLNVTMTITEHHLNASIKIASLEPDKTLVDSSSRMIVTTELFDAESKQLLLRAKDLIKTGENGRGINDVNLMNSVTYWQDVYRRFRSWGSSLKNSL